MATSGVDDDTGVALLRAAADAGITFWDSAQLCEPPAAHRLPPQRPRLAAGGTLWVGQAPRHSEPLLSAPPPLPRHADARHNPATDSTEYNESLLGKAIQAVGRDRVVVATKTGIKYDPKTHAMSFDSSPAFIRASVDESRARLGVETIDLYYLHRIDPATPIEVSMATLKELVADGKIKRAACRPPPGAAAVAFAPQRAASRLHHPPGRYVGLSEASAATIRRAHAVHPLSCVQNEWSLWSRDVEADIIPTCLQLGIGLVAYSPLGRGILTGAIQSKADLQPYDYRTMAPRYADGVFDKNLALVNAFAAVAAAKGAKPGAAALAWVEAKGRQLGLKGCVAIPGTTKPARLLENVASLALKLTPQARRTTLKPASRLGGPRPELVSALDPGRIWRRWKRPFRRRRSAGSGTLATRAPFTPTTTRSQRRSLLRWHRATRRRLTTR